MKSDYRADTDPQTGSISAGRLALPLLQTEYTARLHLAAADLTVAALRLRETAELLIRDLQGSLPTATGSTPLFQEGQITDPLLEHLPEVYRLFRETIVENSPSLPPDQAPLFSTTVGALRRHFCRELFDALKRQGILSETRQVSEIKSTEETVCYVRSHFADAAFDCLFPHLGGPRPLYLENFDQAAEALFDERATALILPYETEDGGMLRGVETLLDGYDFKKELVIEVATPTGKTSYALLRRTLSFLPTADTAEFRIPIGREELLFDLPAFATQVGASTLGAELLRRKYGGFYRFLFRGTPYALLQIYLYFMLEYPNFTAGGFYRVLSETDHR